MDLIYLKNGEEMGFLQNYKGDFDISSDPENYTNNFQIQTILEQEKVLWLNETDTCIVYVPGTEFGGYITGVNINIEDNEITYTGQTWRGLQALFVIEPPEGQSHLVVSGNIRNCLLKFPMHPIIQIASTTYSSNQYQVARYIPTYRGVSGLLRAQNTPLLDSYSYDEESGKVIMSVGPARDLTGLIDLSQDYGEKVRLTITRDGSTPRQLICLGQGELTEREVIHLYASPPDWTISQSGSASAFPAEVYDYSSSENLLVDGIKKYKEIISNHTQIALDIYDMDVRLGDIIAAQDFITREKVTAEVSRVIWRVENNGTYQEEGFQYETKVRT